MNINLYFVALALITLLLMGGGYIILHPETLGLCESVEYLEDCFGYDLYWGWGDTLYSSLNGFFLIFLTLSLIPYRHAKYWYRVVLPLGILGIFFIVGASPTSQHMLDIPRNHVAQNVGGMLFLLTILVVGWSVFYELFSHEKSRGGRPRD